MAERLLPELDPASPFCQRWRDGRHSWRHTSEGGFNPDRYGVDQIPEDAAKSYVLANHYSSSYPSAKRRYGLFDLGEEPVLVGAAVLSVPVNVHVLRGPFPTLTPYYESVELGRLVLDDEVPANAETWFLGQVFRSEAQHGVRGVVSMADPVPRTTVDGAVVFPGHRGAIYIAKSAVYYGRCRRDTVRLLPDGTVLTNREVAKVRDVESGHEYVERRLMSYGARAPRAGESPHDWLDQALIDIGVRRMVHGGNHRYLFPLGTKKQRSKVKLGLPAGPYPKDEAA